MELYQVCTPRVVSRGFSTKQLLIVGGILIATLIIGANLINKNKTEEDNNAFYRK